MTPPEIIGLCSITIALIALYYTRKNYVRQVKEDISVRIFASDKPYSIAWTYRSKNDPNQRLYLVVEWECILINNGEKTVAVTNWTVRDADRFNVVPLSDRIFKIKVAGVKSTEDFHKIIQVHKNVYTIEEDEEITLPITIPSGSSISFKIKIGHFIRRDIQEMVQEELNNDKMEDSTQEVFNFLLANRTWLNPPSVDQFIPVTFKTSKRKYFSDVVFFHKGEAF